MDKLIAYFTTIPDSHRIMMLTGSIFLFWNIENILPVTFNYKKWKHAGVNVLFIFPAAIVQAVLGWALVKTLDWEAVTHWGILQNVPFIAENPLIMLIVSFVALDFCEYVYHVLMHKFKTLWMFHLVHHADRVVDVSSTLREHPGETFIRLSFLILWIFILGVPFWALLCRQFIQIASNVFAHANFRLPEKVDKIVSLVFVTPNMHHVHHHFEVPYTDTNYGDILSIWDRMFGTFSTLSAEKVTFGVDTYMNIEENANFINLIKIPFQEYRPNPKSAILPKEDKNYVTENEELLIAN